MIRALLTAALAPLAVLPARAAAPRPDIVLIVLDTCRADRVSAYGYARPTTPNIDALAGRGTLFLSAYSQSNWTLPSFASFLTGRYPRALGMFSGKGRVTDFVYDDPPLRGSETTLAEALKAGGYRTAAFFTGRHVGPEYGFAQGFDLYRDYVNSSDRKEGPGKAFKDFFPEAEAWRAAGKGAPFFILFHLSQAQRPYLPPDGLSERFAGGYDGPLAGAWLSRPALSSIRPAGEGWTYSPDSSEAGDKSLKLPPGSVPAALSRADIDYIGARYDAALAYADGAVGEITAWADKVSAGRAVIAVAGDHGEGLGEHGGFLHCSDPPRLYEELVRVPLIIAAPGARAGLPVRTPVQLLDLAPTLLDLAGLPAQAGGMQGRSLAPAVSGSAALPEKPLFSETLGHGLLLQSVRSGNWKLIRTAAAGKPARLELYDLAADPGELRDRAGAEPAAAARLGALLDGWAGANDLPGAARPGPAAGDRPVRAGYFHGGRTALMLRLYESGALEKRGLKVDFYAADLRSSDYKVMPRSIDRFNEGGTEKVGKTKGTELIDAMLRGKFDLAMVGESSLVAALHDGKPVVAIARLGHDVRGHAGHVFLMRKGLPAGKREDYLGKVLVSRRAGPGDAIFLREYLERAGVDLARDVLFLKDLPPSPAAKRSLPADKVIAVEDVYEDVMKKGLNNGVIDGGYFHLMSVPKLMSDFAVIKSLDDFGDPELSQALLVATPGFVRAERARLVALLEAYIERIRLEHAMSYEERTRERGKGLQIAINLNGLNYPQYDVPPLVDEALLGKVALLLRKHGFIDGAPLDLKGHIDNGLVLEAMRNLGLDPAAGYPPPEY